MSESKARRFLKFGDPVPGRLEPQVERRQTGMTFDQYATPIPAFTNYIVGHGQQLARARLDALFSTPLPPSSFMRPQVRLTVRKAAKKARAQVQRDADKAARAAFRTNPGVVSSRKAVADRAARRKEANAARANTSPFKHLHSVARQFAEMRAATA